MKHRKPLLRTVAAAVFSYLLLLLLEAASLSSASFSSALLAWLLAGILYTQFVEYWYHRFPMHRNIRFLENIKRNHLEHHQAFYGDHFCARTEEDLSHIAGRWWAFPILFFLHYAVLHLLAPSVVVAAFLLGAVIHYVAFEVTHWYTHVEDSAFDRFLKSIPVIGTLRAYQVEHHRIHHETPFVAFNFNPPYLGDRLFGHMPAGRGLALPDVPLGPAIPSLAPQLGPASPTAEITTAETPAVAGIAWRQRALRYGSAVALGVAVVGIAVLAHGRWSRPGVATSSEQHI